MKPIYKLLLAMVMILSLVACGGGGGGSSSWDSSSEQMLAASLGGSVNGVLSVLQGQELVDSVVVVTELERSELTFTLTSGPAGATVDQEGVFRYTVPMDLAPGTTLPVRITVTPVGSDQLISLEETIYVMERKVVGTATLGPGGGEVSDEWAEIVVSVPAGAVATPTTIEIIRSRDAHGNIVITIQADGVVDDLVEVRLADPELLLLNEPASVPQTPPLVTQSKTTATLNATAMDWNPVVLSPLNKDPDLFLDRKNRINRLPLSSISSVRLSIKEGDRLIAAVSSMLTSYRDLATVEGKIPVLLIHGYTPLPLGFGGGSDTWGELPSLIQKLDGGNKYCVFEFQWITAARFEDVAADLRMAIQRIHKLTKHNVHIIAHSFGGILARTLIQGKATSFPYFGKVDTVVTVGTPHAGIFAAEEQRGDIKFIKGRDSWLLERCEQISCYQMGVDVSFDDFDISAFQLSPEYGEFLAGLSDGRTDLPFKVLIGLTSSRGKNKKLDTGDGLISFAGQRFKAGAKDTDQLLTGNVSETVLRFGQAKPGDANPDPNNHSGYRHSGIPFVLPWDAIAMVEVTSKNHEDHDTFKEIKEWLEKDHGTSGSAQLDPETAFSITVKDAITGAALSGAQVSVKVNNTTVASGTTDASGQVHIQNVSFFPNQTYTAIVSRNGYRASAQHLITKNTPVESPSSFGTVLLWPLPSTSVNPTIAQGPMAGTPGTTFVQWGTGFTPNGTAVLHFRKPDGSEYPTQTVQLDSVGHFMVSYTAPLDKPLGPYTWWAIDSTTGKSSDSVSYEILPASSVNPIIAQGPMAGTPGTTFVQWGTGFTPNGTAVLHFRKPDGTEYPTQTVQLDSIGHFEISYTAPLDKPLGPYTWWAIDSATGKSSIPVSYEILPTGSINPVIAQTPYDGYRGAAFIRWGSGFTPNGTASIHVLKPDGNKHLSFSVNLNSTGHFEFEHIVSENAQIGPHYLWAIDDTTKIQSNIISYLIKSKSSGGYREVVP